MTVKYAVDLSSLTSGVSAAKTTIASVSDATTQATAALKQMSGAADLSRTITGVDVARANLTLLESKVTEAKDKLKTLQDAADAGQAVTGVPEAEAQLTLLEAKAQDAQAKLKQLEDEEQQAGSSASQMATKEEEAATATMSFGERMGAALAGVKGIAGGITDFTSKIGMTIMGFQAMGQMAVQTASSLLQPAATAETTQLSFETLLHSTKAAHDEMSALNSFAASTPMQTQWIDNAAAKMLAFGFSTKDVIPNITAIGDSLSGLGKLSESSLNSIVDIFGKIRAQGKLTGGDMMQLSDWGIPAWQALSQSMHKPIPELQQMVSAGLVPADVAIKSLTQGMEKTFGGGMAKQANTLTGLMSTLASEWQIAMAALGTPVLQTLEPQLSKIVATLSAPAFQQFATSTGKQIGATLSSMVSGFMQLVATGSQVVAFFQRNALAMDALKVVGMVVVGILVAGFAAWAIAAGAAAIATLAATWPIIAIGAAIGLLAGLFLQLYTNSAPFRTFIQNVGVILQQVGAFLASTFVPVWRQLVQVWQTQLLPALSQLWTSLQPLMPVFQGLGAIILGVVVVALVLLIGVIAGVVKGIAGLISGLAIAIGGIVQIFSGLIQIVSGSMTLLLDLVTGNFSRLGADLATIWQGIVTMFTGVWNVIKGVFLAAVGAIGGFVSGFISTIVNLFMGLYNTLVGHSIIPDMINAIVQWFQGLPAKVLAFITNLITMAVAAFTLLSTRAVQMAMQLVTGFVAQVAQLPGKAVSAVSGLAGQLGNVLAGVANSATQWGRNVVQHIIDGINSLAGSVASAAGNIAGQIKKNLGFSSPTEEGPGSTADRWMPNFINMLSTGLIAGVPKMQSAAIATAQPLRAFAPSGAGTAAIVAASSGGGANGGGGYGTSHTFILEVDGRQFTKQVVGPNLDKEVRLKLGAKGRVA